VSCYFAPNNCLPMTDRADAAVALAALQGAGGLSAQRVLLGAIG